MEEKQNRKDSDLGRVKFQAAEVVTTHRVLLMMLTFTINDDIQTIPEVFP